jgi:hypothetical protein
VPVGRSPGVTRSTEPARSRSSRRTRTTTQRSVSRSLTVGARTGRASAEAAAARIAGARFDRLRGTRCGAGILKTVRLVTNLDVSHTVRISTARQRNGSQPTRRLPDRWHAGPGRSRASSRLPRVFRDRARRSKANRVRRRPTSYQQASGGRKRADANASRPSSPCRVRTLHCRFTYKAAHRVAGSIHPEMMRLHAMSWPSTAHRTSLLAAAAEQHTSALSLLLHFCLRVCARLRVSFFVFRYVCLSVCVSVCMCVRACVCIAV